MQPDYITISTWNEHIAQPQLPDYTLLSMGLESDPTSNQRAFVGALPTCVLYAGAVAPCDPKDAFLAKACKLRGARRLHGQPCSCIEVPGDSSSAGLPVH